MERRPRWGVFVPLLSAAACAAAALWWGERLQFQPFDDAYITLRAAANWAAGHGPVFNPAEGVESTTSPLWTALLALGVRLGANPEALVGLLGVAFAAAAGAVASALAIELAGPLAGAAAGALLAALPAWSGWAPTGMEVPLAGLTLALAAWAAVRGRPVWGGVLGAMAALARPEALVLVPVLAASAAAAAPERRLRAALRFGLPCALPLCAAFLARHAYFGAWLPNTYVAKRGGLGAGAPLRGVRTAGTFCLPHPALAIAVACGARARPT